MAVDDFSPHELARIEATTQEVGRYLFQHIERRKPHIFERRWWDDRLLSWAMRDESIKVQMFRFIDVLPMLRTAEEVNAHLQEYFDEVREKLPEAAQLGMRAASASRLLGRALAYAARRNARSYARRFIAGTRPEEVLAAIRRARRERMAFTLDLLGEAVISEVEAERYLQAYLDLIERLAPQVNAWPEEPQIDRGMFTRLPRFNVSVKLSALDSQFDALDSEGTFRRAGDRLRRLLRVARQHDAFVNVDMESYATKHLTLEIFRRILMEDEFRDVGDVGIVIQCYLRDAQRDLVALRDWAVQRGKPVWVRLVKGAYWDYETIHARYHGWPVPVFQKKWQSDANFERLTRFLMRNWQHLRPALGSHNIRSLAHGIAVARHLGLAPLGFELQMLFGMADAEKHVFVGMGHRLRVYMPFGELIPGMAYLVRRLLENTSNDSFLRASFTELLSPDALLANPLSVADGPLPWDSAPCRRSAAAPQAREEPVPRCGAAGAGRAAPPLSEQNPPGEPSRERWHSIDSGTEAADMSTVIPVMPTQRLAFRNEPVTDFAQASARQAMQRALEHVARQLGGHRPLWIDHHEVDTPDRLESYNPSHKRQRLGTTAAATAEHVQQAVQAALRAWPDWASRDVAERVDLVRRAAQKMRDRRYELAAWQVYECGKPWREADADVCEAIDFCEYYALGALVLQGTEHRADAAGEENRLEYVPRGVAAVIAPWNFPLAILTGMTVAALVTGNCVIMKPAEQSSHVAGTLLDVFREVDLPPGVLQYLPGRGEIAGAALVEHPDVSLVAFTGSRNVGLWIHRRAAETSAAGGKEVKRVIAEMGGKNAIIVDDDADLDEAVAGVVRSAFGYQGQKCSACSRCIVLQGVYDQFLPRLVEATRSLKIAPAEDPGCRVGPVIDEEALQRITRYIEAGRREATLALAIDVGPLADEGFYIGPHIFVDVPPQASIAQEEIFGPVLAVLRAGNFDEALAIANATQYALTAGVYSRSPRNLRRAARQLVAGNVYLNRPITGALVGRQPFGGYRLSGIGSKAGGPDYLLQFVVPRTITENTLRRGFAPMLDEGSQ
jgi:RHH-type proline utilization regulon transcriptional repressor/proline dehydrogenase/delta 1-pyrroline-5-carboxylate dehydrogenase